MPRVVTSGPRFPCPKPGCTTTFTRLTDVRRHIITLHSANPPQFRCPDCAYVAKAAYNLKAHISAQHLGQHRNDYTCDDCGASYKCSANLTRHLKSKHSNLNRHNVKHVHVVRQAGQSTGDGHSDDGKADVPNTDAEHATSQNRTGDMETAATSNTTLQTPFHTSSTNATQFSQGYYDNSAFLHFPHTPALTDAPTPASSPDDTFGSFFPVTPNIPFGIDTPLAMPAPAPLLPFSDIANWVNNQYTDMSWGVLPMADMNMDLSSMAMPSPIDAAGLLPFNPVLQMGEPANPMGFDADSFVYNY